jgi:hypothetical protein
LSRREDARKLFRAKVWSVVDIGLLTDAAAKAYGLPRQAMVVVIKENSPENVGIGGELLANRVKETKQSCAALTSRRRRGTIPTVVPR